MKAVIGLVRRLQWDERGVATIEYLEVLVLVTVGTVIAMAPLGTYLLHYYDNVEFITGLPFP